MNYQFEIRVPHGGVAVAVNENDGTVTIAVDDGGHEGVAVSLSPDEARSLASAIQRCSYAAATH